MSMTAPNSYVTPASPVVMQQMARLNDNADQLLVLTEAAINELQTLSFANVDLDPRFQFSQDDLDALLEQLGPLPDIDIANWTAGLDLSAGNQDFVFNAALLARLQEALPEFILPAVPTPPPLPDAPADPGDPPDVPVPLRPDLVDYSAPDIDTNIPVPQYEDATAQVPFPTLRPITLPTPPVLNIDSITFNGVEPVFEGTLPDPAEFDFTPGTYTSTLLDRAKQACLDQMNGNTGLPPAVEDAMFERAREREAELGERNVQQVTEEWAAKGHRIPAGPLARQSDRAREEANAKISQLNRDQFIELWRIQIEQFRNGLSSAIALEEATMRLFSQSEQLRFDAMRAQLDMALGIFNAAIAKYNADAQVFSVQAAVYRERIQAEQAKVSIYAEELRAQQLIGELNEQDVRIFAERLRALQINADIYRAKMDGYVAQFRAIDSQINVYRAQLESNAQLVGIYEADTRAFGTLVQASLTRTERFATKAEMYSKQVDAWRVTYDGMLKGYDSQVEKARLQRDVYAANSDRLQAWVGGETGRIRSLTEKYQAIAAEIGARSESEQTKYQLSLAIAQASLARYQAAADILLKNGEININSGLTAANLMLRAKETATTTLAQLAAGMTSAANVNASISDSSSSGLSYNFSGEIEVA